MVQFCDVSVNSEFETLKALNQQAIQLKKKHKVILMVDLGDLREGYFKEEHLAEAINYAKQAKGLDLYGLGTNLTCFSFVQSDEEKMNRLLGLAKKLRCICMYQWWQFCDYSPDAGKWDSWKESITFVLVSLCCLAENGQTMSICRESSNDAFIMEAEIIESKEKPSMPIGKIGADSYGHVPVFTDRGIRKRAICALGRQDVDVETMWPVDEGVEIIGASSDHLIVDVTDCEKEFKTGDRICFRLGYFAVMRAFTSKYEEKIYEKQEIEKEKTRSLYKVS